jgi:hypothetical protein
LPSPSPCGIVEERHLFPFSLGELVMRRLLSLFGLLLLVGPLPAEDKPGPHYLFLSPRQAAEPALRRRLLPELVEQRPGNAAEHYQKAGGPLKGASQELSEAVYAWTQVPLEEFPKKEVRELLARYEKATAEAEAGACCESCDWGHTSRIRKDNIGAGLSDIQDLRTLGTLFELRIRLEVAEGSLDQAVRSARTLLTMSRHATESPTLISALIGAALASKAAERLEEILQLPDAPNLYWALTDLPRPFLDLRKALQGERLGAYSIFYPDHPETYFDLDAGPWTKDEARIISGRLYNTTSDVTGISNRYLFGFTVMKKHEAAKRALLAAGRPRERVEAMPPLQVALLHSLAEYDVYMDDCLKWQAAPYWESLAPLQESERRLKQSRAAALDPRSDAPAMPVAHLLFPATHKVLSVRARVDRRLAMLRCIEALRLHAAAHDDKLPATLAEIKDVPAPVDPVTGKAFAYELKGGSATLSSTPFDGRSDWANAPSFDITMRTEKKGRNR